MNSRNIQYLAFLHQRNIQRFFNDFVLYNLHQLFLEFDSLPHNLTLSGVSLILLHTLNRSVAPKVRKNSRILLHLIINQLPRSAIPLSYAVQIQWFSSDLSSHLSWTPQLFPEHYHLSPLVMSWISRIFWFVFTLNLLALDSISSI